MYYLFWHKNFKNLDRTHGAKLRIQLTLLTPKKKTRGAKLKIQLKSNWIFSQLHLLLYIYRLLHLLIFFTHNMDKIEISPYISLNK